jgi:tripartite-type tricarboxylate transporter receptor subunit TctC
MRLMSRLLLLLCWLLACVPCGAMAQAFPTKPVRIVVHVPAGGLQDSLARAAAQSLGKIWPQPVLIENRPAAGGSAGADFVLRSAPDGHTVFQTGVSTILANEMLLSRPAFNIAKDFAPVLVLASADNIVIGAPNLPANNIQELVALARSKPGALNYGSFGIGSGQHVDAEALARVTGVSFTHIPYKGGAPLMTALAAGEIQFAFAGMTAAIPLIKQGRIKALAFGGPQRSSVLPQVPTLAESGLERFYSRAWFGWFVPLATPAAVVEKLAADTGRVISAPEFVATHLHAVGHELVNAPGPRLLEMLDADRKTYAERIRPLNLKLD